MPNLLCIDADRSEEDATVEIIDDDVQFLHELIEAGLMNVSSTSIDDTSAEDDEYHCTCMPSIRADVEGDFSLECATHSSSVYRTPDSPAFAPASPIYNTPESPVSVSKFLMRRQEKTPTAPRIRQRTSPVVRKLTYMEAMQQETPSKAHEALRLNDAYSKAWVPTNAVRQSKMRK